MKGEREFFFFFSFFFFFFETSCTLKMPGPISQNGIFYSNDASSPKISWLQISFKSVKLFGHKKRLRILQLPIPYALVNLSPGPRGPGT